MQRECNFQSVLASHQVTDVIQHFVKIMLYLIKLKAKCNLNTARIPPKSVFLFRDCHKRANLIRHFMAVGHEKQFHLGFFVLLNCTYYTFINLNIHVV